MSWAKLSPEARAIRIEKTAAKIRGHKNPRLSAALMGRRVWNKGLARTEADKQAIRIGTTKAMQNLSQEARDGMRQARVNQSGREFFKLHPEIARECGKRFWENPEKARRIAWKRPTKPERTLLAILDQHFPEEWKYVGDGQVRFGTRCPDFININGKKVLIEVFGLHWHKIEDGPERSAYFNRYGFATLVIWENELSEPNSVVAKIKAFGG